MLLLTVMMAGLTSCYRMRVEVDHIPSNTPANADIYITGEFNSWDPGDNRYILEKLNDSVYYIDLPRGVGELEYKFTRGDWSTVEKDNCGYEIENRILQYGGDRESITDAIRSWADLDPVDCDKLTIIITSLPENTPPEAQLALACNANNWDITEELFFRTDSLLQQPVLTLYRPGDAEILEYKVTRGSLTRSEADGLGREIKPRVYRFGEADTIFVEVQSWYDLEQSRKDMVTLLVESIPGNTPADDQIYYVGEINDWYPHDGNLMLEKNRKGQYFINLPKRAYNKEYKFTRGNWNTVERDAYGYEINNRSLKREKSGDTVIVRIESWKDLSYEMPGKIFIRIIQLPENTPPDEDIFIAGNFNNWNPGSGNWRLKKGSDGSYQIEVPRGGNLLEFKFTRGSWNSVEVNASGEDIDNRTYRYGEVDTLDLSVVKWKDLQ